MQIALDAMGGDHGPQELIAGALLAAEQSEITVYLVGDEILLNRHIAALPAGKEALSRLKVFHAPTAVGMDENPVDAIRKKKDSSIMVAFDLVKTDVVLGGGERRQFRGNTCCRCAQAGPPEECCKAGACLHFSNPEGARGYDGCWREC